MGQRMAALWHLGMGHLGMGHLGMGHLGEGSDIDGLVGPRIIVASVRAMLQRLVPWDEMPPPLVVRAGAVLDAAATVAALVAAGYRREHQVEHRGEVAVRGGIIDVFPSTSDLPVRIDLWGDEVDRLTVFDVADQRSIGDLDSVAVFGCRELLPSPAVRARAAELVDVGAVGPGAVGEAGGRPGLRRHGVVAAVAAPGGAPPDRPAAAGRRQVVLVEPRRVRDRAVELADEEAALADALAATWGASAGGRVRPAAQRGRASGSPASTCRSTACWRRARPPVLSLVSVAEGPATPAVTVRGFDPVAGDPSRLASQVTGLVDGGYSVTLCSPTDAGAGRLSTVLAEEGVAAPLSSDAVGAPGVRVVAAPLAAGFVVPDARVAVLSESDVTGRRTPHRPARPRARPTDGFFDDLAPGSYVVHRQHGVARYAGVTTRAVGGTTRDYLVLEYRGSDRLYLPVDQIEAVTPYSGGEAPTLSKMGGADWQRARAKARAAAGEIADELVELYRRRAAVEGHAFGPDTPWQTEMEGAFPYTQTADQLRAIAEVKADMEQPRPMDRLVCGDVGFGKTEVAVRAVFKAVQDGKQAAVLVPTTLLASQHYQTFADRFAAYPVRVELISRFLSNAAGPEGGRRPGRRLGRRRRRHPPAARPGHRVQGPRAAGRRRGAAVRGHPQGGRQAADRRGRRADADGQPDPAHARDGADRHPRPLDRQHAAGRPPTDPHLRRRAGRSRGLRGHPARAAARGPGLLRPQPRCRHRRGGPPPRRGSCPRPGWRSPTARWTRAASSRSSSTSGSASTTCSSARRSSSPASTCRRSTRSSSIAPTCSGSASSTRSAAGSAGATSGRTPTSSTRPIRCSPSRPTSGCGPSASTPSSGRASRSPCATSRSAAPATCSGTDQSGHIAAVGYDLYVQLVAEAVAEARGEPRPVPPTISLDVPGDAHLPADYVAGGGRPGRGLPAAGLGDDGRRRRRRRRGVGRPVRAAARAGRGAAGPGPPARRLPRRRRDRRRGPAGPGRRGPPPGRPDLPPGAAGQRPGPAAAPVAPGATYREEQHQLVVPLDADGRPADALRSRAAPDARCPRRFGAGGVTR